MLCFRRLFHRLAQQPFHFTLLALQQQCRVAHIGRIILLADQPDTGSGAALDLVQQTGARTVGEHAILAGADAKNLLQQIDAFLGGG